MPTPTDNITRAIIRRFMDTPALATATPGGITLGLATPTVLIPYCEIHGITWTFTFPTAPAGWHLRENLFQINVYADADDDAVEIADMILNEFNPQMTPLPIANGSTVVCYPQGGTPSPAPDEQISRMGLPLRRQIVELMVKTTRTTQPTT